MESIDQTPQGSEPGSPTPALPEATSSSEGLEGSEGTAVFEVAKAAGIDLQAYWHINE